MGWFEDDRQQRDSDSADAGVRFLRYFMAAIAAPALCMLAGGGA